MVEAECGKPNDDPPGREKTTSDWSLPSVKEGKTLVSSFLRDSAVRFPDKIALVFGQQRLSYREIDLKSNQLANTLLNNGVKRGERIIIYLDNSVETVISIFGVLKAGAAFVVVNRSTKLDKLVHIGNNSGAVALITDKRFSRLLPKVIAQINLKTIIITGEVFEQSSVGATRLISFNSISEFESAHEPPQECIDVDLAALIYTSGSTGLPKGVTLTHQNMVVAATSITTYLENDNSDIILNLLPLSFDYGLYQVLMAFKIGGTVILEKSFLYPYTVIETIQNEKVTGFPVVPTIVAMLMKLQYLEQHDFSTLRYISNTGAHMPAAFVKWLRQTFPSTSLYLMYGLTECKRVSYLPPSQVDIRPDSVGIAMPNTEVYVVDDGGNVLEPGEVGELVVRGASVMREYWRAPGATNKVLRPGRYPWEKVLYTGDLFKIDEDGYLYFVARKDDIIKSRGEKVSPKEVENVIHAMDGVAEAAVIGVDDEILGQAIKAFVVPTGKSAISEKEVLRHCGQHLEDFMLPKYIEFCESLPKTSSGKTKKTALN